ncbi:MAG: glycosyltransferase family 39 protein, partial [Bacteroidia bacterium]|nr:glycosyltransferase family 39 protein [Bacteroidia bacterium]
MKLYRTKENFFANFCQKKNIQILLILAVILFLGSFLRLYRLDFQSLWYDECGTIRRSNVETFKEIFSGVFEEKFSGDLQPPLHHIIYYFLIKYTENSPAIIRMPAVLAGIASIVLMFLTGKRLFSVKEGLISAAFTAFFWTPIFFSQEARPYSFLLCLSLLTVYLNIYLLDKLKQKKKSYIYYFIAFCISGILCCYIHYFGLLLVLLLAADTLIYSLNNFKIFTRIIVAFFIILAAFSFWLPGMWHHFTTGESNIERPHFIDIIYYFEWLYNWSEILTKTVFFFYCFLFLFTAYSIIKNKMYKFPRKIFSLPEIQLGLWLLLPFALVYLLSYLFNPV